MTLSSHCVFPKRHLPDIAQWARTVAPTSPLGTTATKAPRPGLTGLRPHSDERVRVETFSSSFYLLTSHAPFQRTIRKQDLNPLTSDQLTNIGCRALSISSYRIHREQGYAPPPGGGGLSTQFTSPPSSVFQSGLIQNLLASSAVGFADRSM